MSIESIYEPIKPEILQLEEELFQVAREAPPEVAELVNHVLKPGKRIRPALTLLAGKFYHYDPEALLPMAAAVELLHTAALVHDDSIDASLWRRGKPTVNSLWDDHTAVLLGDYLFATSAYITTHIGNIRVMRIFGQTLMEMSSGEISQTLNPFDLKQTRQHYFRRIGDKTSCLLSMAAESGAVLSEAPEEVVQSLKSYGYNLGMGFQIVDDILDVIGMEERMGKPVGSDLLHGILTLPALLALERYPEDNPISKVFSTHSQDDLRSAMEIILDPSILEECYSIAQQFCSQACLCLEHLPHNAAYSSLVSLASHVVERRK